MFSLFKKNKYQKVNTVSVDIHSHLIPAVDDGVESLQESISIIRQFEALGYKKIITTPHIKQDFFDNNPAGLKEGLFALRQRMTEEGLSINIELAAEYYLDEHLLELIDKGGDELLIFGKKYLLFETSFLNQPFYINDFIFKVKSNGLTPVLAHPERYVYVHEEFDLVEDLITRGVLLQININSLTGYYSKQIKKLAQKLIDKKMVHFIGSDCHNEKHLKVMQQAFQEKYYHKVLDLPLLNETLLNQ